MLLSLRPVEVKTTPVAPEAAAEVFATAEDPKQLIVTRLLGLLTLKPLAGGRPHSIERPKKEERQSQIQPEPNRVVVGFVGSYLYSLVDYYTVYSGS